MLDGQHVRYRVCFSGVLIGLTQRMPRCDWGQDGLQRVLLRGALVNRTYGTHKKIKVDLFTEGNAERGTM